VDICEEWMKFETFISDVGPRPSPQHSLDRIDNNKGYEPGNCYWATQVEQMNNQRGNRWIMYGGQVETLANWARLSGIPRAILANRLHRGWDAERAITTPLGAQR
jgi:hypothetical protein